MDRVWINQSYLNVPIDICKLRLDFESFTILGTGNTVEADTVAMNAGGVCLDTFDVTVSIVSSMEKSSRWFMALLVLKCQSWSSLSMVSVRRKSSFVGFLSDNFGDWSRINAFFLLDLVILLRKWFLKIYWLYAAEISRIFLYRYCTVL